MPNLSRLDKGVKEEEQMSKHRSKKSTKDKVLWITGSICALLIALVCLFIIVYPKLVAVPDVVIPDVYNLTVVEAETKLKEIGLNVASDVEEKENDEVEPGKVIGTNPQTGRTVKEGTEVIIIIAKESGKITLEDYKGQNYKTVEANLKNAGLNVIVEQKKIAKEDQDNYEEGDIVSQSAAAETKLEPGDTIVLYYAVFTVEYPDFVTEGYSIDDVQAFCDENNIKLNITYETSDEYPENTIIKQNRTGEVISGSTLTITVTKKSVQEQIDPVEPIEGNE